MRSGVHTCVCFQSCRLLSAVCNAQALQRRSLQALQPDTGWTNQDAAVAQRERMIDTFIHSIDLRSANWPN